MVDIIATAFLLGIFWAGFKAGNRFKTLTEMLQAGLNKLG